MHMIGHYRKQRNIKIHVDPYLRRDKNLLFQIFTNFRQTHDAILNLAKEMFPVLGTNGDKIEASIVLMPPCTGCRDSVTTFEFYIIHGIHNWFQMTNIGIISLLGIIVMEYL